MAPDGASSGPEREEGTGAEGQADYMEDLDEDDRAAECRRQNHHPVYDEVENYYLQSGATAVSIMQLPMCVDKEIISEGEGLEEICLVGHSVTESREIRVLAEKWKLDLHPNSPPTFLVKTACGWIRVQKPKVVYRRIMTDGLTLAHFLHYVRKHPSASANAAKEHLENEFRKFGEKPSLERLANFFPVIRRYMELDREMRNPTILEDFFPGHFSDGVAPFSIREINGRRGQDEQQPASDSTIDLNQAMSEDHEKQEKRGLKSTSSSKAVKTQRASVQAELRNLHSQWCSLLGGRATVKADKKSVSNQGRARKAERPKHASKKSESRTPPSKKADRQDNVSKKGRPSKDSTPDPKKRRASECEAPTVVSKKVQSSERRRPDLSSIPSLESKTSILDQQEKWKSLNKVVSNAKKSEEKTMNLRRKKGEMKLEPTPASEIGDPGPSRMIPTGVHSPSTDLFDRLEDPPICTICDDGGDLICCEGPCQRHFHATPGGDISCQTLGLTSEQVKRIDKYYCKNCLLKQHQCFICLELGPSAPSSPGRQEVYLCDAPGCRKFYHAGCVAKALDPAQDWTAMAERIERGLHGFLCPRHTCAVCTSNEIQPGIFVQCRRCPKAWHRDCLTNFPNSGELPTTLIWKHYDREFVYCKKHKILPDILTPAQDHLRFPNEERGRAENFWTGNPQIDQIKYIKPGSNTCRDQHTVWGGSFKTSKKLNLRNHLGKCTPLDAQNQCFKGFHVLLLDRFNAVH